MVRGKFTLFLLVFLALPIVVLASSSESQNTSEWRMDGRTLNGTHYYPGPIPGDISQLTANTYAAGGSAGDPIIVNGEFYGLALRSKIAKLNASNISQEIQVASSSNVYQIPIAPIWNTFIYTGHENGQINQRNISNISQIIATNSNSNGQHYSSPIVYEEYVYFTDWHSTGGNYIYQANASNVTQWFERYSISNCDGGPRIANGYYYHICGSSTVVQLNATNVSQMITQHSYGGGYDTGSSLAIANGFLYFGNDNDIFYQLNASNVSQVIATYTAGGDFDTTPAVANGYAYIVSNDGYTYQLNASNVSQQIANYSTGSTAEGVTVTDDYLLVGGTSTLFQLDANNISKQISNYTVSSADTPVIVDGNIYFASGNTFYQLSATLPVTALLSPVNGYEISSLGENISFNCTSYATEGLTNISLYITDNNNANFTLNRTSNISGISNSSGWTLELSEGTYTWGCLSFDSQNNSDWSVNRTITPDQTSPSISILSPIDNFNTTNIELNVTYLASDDNLDSCWYSNDTMTTNTSLAGCTNLTSIIWSEGQHNVTIWANDTLGNVGSNNIIFRIDLTAPSFNLTNKSIGEKRTFGYDINATDDVAVSCYSINDTTNFAINCSGYLSNNTNLSVGQRWINLTVNDTLGNTNSKIMRVNVTLVGKVGISFIYPNTAINVSKNSLFNVTINLSCNRANCGLVNISLSAFYGNESDIKMAFVCYDTSCTYSDDLRGFLSDEGFNITKKKYNTWSDATLNTTAFDVMVAGGYYLAQDYGFDNAADAPRDAFEDEAMPTVIVSDECDACLDMGITTTDGTVDSSQTTIMNISSHNIMTGYSGTVTVDSYSDDVGYYANSNFNDPYSYLFEGGASNRISGFALDAGQATTGTNPGKFVWLGMGYF